MLGSLAIIFIVLWLVGLVTAYTLGGLIHLLLGLAVVMMLVNVIHGPRVV